MQIIKQSIITIIICLVILTGVNLVYAWTGPTQAPPGGNVAAPINVSSVSQFKAGALSIGGLLQTAAFQLTTGAGAGKVLTSDAVGLASWQIGGGGGGVTSVTGSNGVTASPTTGAVVASLTNPTKLCGAGFAIQSFDLRNANAPGCVAVGGASGVTGSGTAGRIPKWSTATSLTNSGIRDTGSNIIIDGQLGVQGMDPTIYKPAGWGGGISAADITATWSMRTNSLCLGGGGGSTNAGDCRSAWPGAGAAGTLTCNTKTCTAGYSGCTATCDAGYTVTGGGAYDIQISPNCISRPSGETGWFGTCYSNESSVTVHARCCKIQ